MLYSNPTYIESGKKAIALFFMVSLFFVYAVEAMHHHSDVDYNCHTEVSVTSYSPQCLICDQLQHQHHDFILVAWIHLPESPIFDTSKPTSFYAFTFYPSVNFTSPNKDPPTRSLTQQTFYNG